MAGAMRWSAERDPRVEQLEQLASSMVGDEGKPNVFFVSVKGMIQIISIDFTVAYRAWRTYSEAMDVTTALEDRQHGVLASVQSDVDENENETGRLIRWDDTRGFGLR